MEATVHSSAREKMPYERSTFERDEVLMRTDNKNGAPGIMQKGPHPGLLRLRTDGSLTRNSK